LGIFKEEPKHAVFFEEESSAPFTLQRVLGAKLSQGGEIRKGASRQLVEAGGCPLTFLDHFFVVGGVGGEARGSVRDKRKGGYAATHGMEGDGFGNGGHTHSIPSQVSQHADFSGGFVGRPHDLSVNPFFEALPRVGGTEDFTGKGTIDFGHCRETGAEKSMVWTHERTPGSQIDVVHEEH
jgi:hypothetical protein